MAIRRQAFSTHLFVAIICLQSLSYSHLDTRLTRVNFVSYVFGVLLCMNKCKCRYNVLYSAQHTYNCMQPSSRASCYYPINHRFRLYCSLRNVVKRFALSLLGLGSQSWPCSYLEFNQMTTLSPCRKDICAINLSPCTYMKYFYVL